MKDCKISSVFLELCLHSAGGAVKRHLHVVAQDFSKRCEAGDFFAAVTSGCVV